MEEKDVKKQAAAKARAKSLTPERRSEIATKAALKKAGYPSATHIGSINIAGALIPCAVLDDGRRVVWQREVVGLLTGNKKGGLGRYLAASNLENFVPEKFKNNDFNESAISFELNGRKSNGFEGEDIVDICKMYLQARKANCLLPSQIHLAHQAEIIVLALAKIGIAALIDEATGYQEIRDKMALQMLLDKYLLKEHAAWAKRFPDDFYKEMFRLKDWEYPTVKGAKPSVVGTYTNDLVYERIEVGLLKELEEKNPKRENGSRKSKHHQWLSDDIGAPALNSHLHAVIAFMRISKTWTQFKDMVNLAFPKKGQQLPLLLED